MGLASVADRGPDVVPDSEPHRNKKKTKGQPAARAYVLPVTRLLLCRPKTAGSSRATSRPPHIRNVGDRNESEAKLVGAPEPLIAAHSGAK